MNQHQKSLTITLDHLPTGELSPNARVHWAQRHRASRLLKAETYYLARQRYSGPPMSKAIISFHFQLDSRRRRDPDNLVASMKPAIDGLVLAGVLVDDDSEHLIYGGVIVNHGETQKTIIAIKETE